jgi:hypothetical protein
MEKNVKAYLPVAVLGLIDRREIRQERNFGWSAGSTRKSASIKAKSIHICANTGKNDPERLVDMLIQGHRRQDLSRQDRNSLNEVGVSAAAAAAIVVLTG